MKLEDADTAAVGITRAAWAASRALDDHVEIAAGLRGQSRSARPPRHRDAAPARQPELDIGRAGYVRLDGSPIALVERAVGRRCEHLLLLFERARTEGL